MNGGKTRDHRHPPSSGQHDHRGKRSRSFGTFFHQLDDKDGRRDVNRPLRSTVPVSTWNVGVTAINRPCLVVHQQACSATGIGSIESGRAR